MTTTQAPEKHQTETRLARGVAVSTAILTVAVALVWGFPSLWYTRSAGGEELVWFGESTNVAGWACTPVAISESAERLLVADQTFTGQFVNPATKERVQAFSAKRYTHKSHDTGLFLHTPDRCWTLAGWRFEPVTPDSVEVTVHGVRMQLERRVFVAPGQRELVYFGGLVGGRPLPYRLDHNLSVGMRFASSEAKSGESRGFFARAIDARLWGRVWDGFVFRRQLLGPKQFIRVSTSLQGSDIRAADQLLVRFLESWLTPIDYEAELAAWNSRKS